MAYGVTDLSFGSMSGFWSVAMRMPPLPERDAHGRRPAIATAKVVMARKIIRARATQALSRRRLAEEAGVSVETLARIESGRHMPRPLTIEKLTRVLGEI